MAGPVDCHCHLGAPCFQPDVAAVVRAAEQAAVSALVVVSEQAGEFRSVLELSERFPGFVLPCLGVHPVQEVSPEEQRSVTLKDLDDALPLIEFYKDKLVGIGEVGLDFTPRFASTDEQKEGQRQVLIKQIELARRLDLPLNVHSRSAGRPTINLLKEQGATKVLLHAFDGKPSVAMEGVRAGYYFSIPPSIIRSEQQKLVKQLPLENMCLETDSPALGPEKQMGREQELTVDIQKATPGLVTCGPAAANRENSHITEFSKMLLEINANPLVDVTETSVAKMDLPLCRSSVNKFAPFWRKSPSRSSVHPRPLSFSRQLPGVSLLLPCRKHMTRSVPAIGWRGGTDDALWARRR